MMMRGVERLWMNGRRDSLLSCRRLIACAGLALLSTGCVQQPVEPAQTADPSIEPVTGISKSALAGVMGLSGITGEHQFGIFFYPDKIDKAQLSAAPARLCASRGWRLLSAEDKPLQHPEEMPGVRQLVVRCS
jgi:hypothetical protein